MTPEKHRIGGTFIELQSVDSTNNYAMRLVHEGVAQHGFAVFAHEQTAGKGQREKQWLAQPGANIMMSLVIKPGSGYASPSFLFSMALSLAAHGLLKKFAAGVKIKWPNDLLIRDRKAGGILIEDVLRGSTWNAAVVGFGLNINQTEFGELAAKATSLKQATGQTHDPIALAKELCTTVDAVLKDWETHPETIRRDYHQHLYKLGDWVRLKQGTRVFEAQVKGVAATGQLVTQHAVEERFNVGDVEWM